MKKVLFMALLAFVCVMPVKAEKLNLAESAKSAMLIEASTGEVIYEKDSDKKMVPASMTKMMSMLLIMESIDNGIIKWTDKVTVSENAASMGGSQILLEVGEKMTVEDMFKGISIASGNDAVVAMAEKIGGSVDVFVNMMNERAKQLGLKNTSFKNPHGLDADDHYSSARDMSIIARELVKHEKVLTFTSVYEDYLREGTDRKLWLVNTNKLVRFYEGVDGLKTGYTEEAGYCLTATAKKNDMRIIAVVMGEPDSKVRNKEVSEMLDYAFAQYEIHNLLGKQKTLGKYEVDKASKKYIEIVPQTEVTILKKKGQKEGKATYDITLDKLKAPVKKGASVGTLQIKENGNVIRSVDLTVKESVTKASLFQLYLRYMKDIFTADTTIIKS